MTAATTASGPSAREAASSPAERMRALALELVAHDAWSRDELLAHQDARLRALLRHAVATSACYRDALGPDAAERPLSELPTLSKPS